MLHQVINAGHQQGRVQQQQRNAQIHGTLLFPQQRRIDLTDMTGTTQMAVRSTVTVGDLTRSRTPNQRGGRYHCTRVRDAGSLGKRSEAAYNTGGTRGWAAWVAEQRDQHGAGVYRTPQQSERAYADQIRAETSESSRGYKGDEYENKGYDGYDGYEGYEDCDGGRWPPKPQEYLDNPPIITRPAQWNHPRHWDPYWSRQLYYPTGVVPVDDWDDQWGPVNNRLAPDWYANNLNRAYLNYRLPRDCR